MASYCFTNYLVRFHLNEMNKYSKLSKQVLARIYRNRFYERCPMEKHHLLYNRGCNTNPFKPADDKKLSEEDLNHRSYFDRNI